MLRGLVVALLLASSARAADAPQSGWVVLAVDEYRALRDKAYPRPADPPGPPVDATLTRLEYELRVEGDAAVGTARLFIDVVKEGWVRVPIPAGLHVGAARVDGRPVTLSNSDDDTPGTEVLLSRAGRTVVALEIAAPIAATGGTESISLPPGGSAVTRVAVVVPRGGVDVTLSGALLAENENGPQQSRWVAYGHGRSAIGLSWRRKVEDHRATLPLRLWATLVQHAGFGEETVHLVAEVRVDVLQGVARNLALRVPEGLAIDRVSGNNVGDWEARGTTLTITFLDPVASAETLLVTAEGRCPRDGRLDVPLLRVVEAERETGGVAVEVLGAGEITAHDARAMDAADTADLGEGIGGRTWGLVDAFRFRAQEGRAPRRLSVTVSRYTPQAVLMATVEEARYQVLLDDDGKTLVHARYAVRNNAQAFLVAALPAGATLWSAAVGGRPVRPGRSAEGAFLLPLEKSRAGVEAPPFVVELAYLERGAPWAAAGHTRLTLPALDLPVARLALLLRYSPRRRLRFEPGPLREQAYRVPFSPVLTAASTSPAPASGRAVGTADAQGGDLAGVQGFKDRIQKIGGGRRATGILPVQVSFPSYGALAFLTSELTKEGEAPVLDLQYKATKGGRR